MTKNEKSTVSAAFFCPQTTAADEAYLASLYAYLSQHRYGRPLLAEVAALADHHLWETFASARADVRALSHGPQYLAILRNWAVTGVSGPLASIRSNITSLPLLAVIQIGQYLRYLEVHGHTHREFVAQVKEGAGGIHGYCGGLPAAISIACAQDESELVKHMATAMRITVGIGAYTEAGDDNQGAERTMLAVRLKYEGQGEELTRRFPGTYISAVTGPRSISIGGPAATVDELFYFITEHEGLRAQKIDLGGSAHNPANRELAAELCRLCHEASNLQLPDASRLQVSLRSNQAGERILGGSLTDDLIVTNLAARCEWFDLLKGVAQDLTQSPRLRHEFVIFGWADCVTMSPFHQRRLQVNKTLAKGLILPEPLPIESPAQEQEQESSRSLPSFPDNAIAIVGASCRLPGASNMEELWRLLASGTNRVQELSTVDRFDLPGSFRASQSGSLTQRRTFYGNFIDDVKRFDNTFFGISAREAANMDPQQRIALELSFEALEDAGYLASHQRATGDNVGCFVGLVLAEYMDNTNGHPPTAYTSTGTVPAFLCGRISHRYGWSGPSEMFNTACSSSMVAINRACKAIQTGECRMALAGGVNVIAGVNNYLDLAKAGFLSPTGQCKPFDASADGYCRADGAGFVVLKKLGQAVADGDAIWGVIPGVGTNQAGLSTSITVPDPAAQRALYWAVLEQAGCQADQVTYVEAHGTGTQVGDPLEMESIRSVFGSASRQQSVYVGSIKGNVGHSEPAAGVAGLLKVLAMLRHSQIPPQVGYRLLNPKIARLDQDGIAIPRSLHPWNAPFRAALVNSYGAAGSNGALLCCDHPQSDSRRLSIAPHGSFPLLVTAMSQASLVENARALGAYLGRKAVDPDMHLADVAFTLSQRRQRHKCFASVTADTIKGAAQLLGSLGPSEVYELPTQPGPDPPSKPAIVLVFSGQSSSTIALPGGLHDSFPVFQSYLDACDAEFRKLGHPSLLPVIFQANVIDDIIALQCGTFAVQYACARCWMDAGAQPRAIIGHSLGELTALAVSGVLSLADSIKLVAARGHLIAMKWGLEKGSMLAVECTVDEWAEIASVVKQEHDPSPPEIACYNGLTSLVVAGPVGAIAAAENTLRTQLRFQEIRFQRLHTSHGFHSALTEPILADLAAIAQSLTWNEPSVPLYTCTEDPESGHQDVAQHMRQPVFFANAVRRVEDALGPSCVWLEAGVDTPITAMTRRACRQPNAHVFQPIKARGRPRPADVITDAVASLWRTGIFLSHWAFLGPDPGQRQGPDGARVCRPVWLPPYQFAKTQYWLDNIDRVVEMQQAARLENMSAPVKAGALPPPPPPQLVTRRQVPSTTRAGYAEFLVNTQSGRFRSVVRGHMVCSHALCPAPLYMESATMGLLLLLGDNQGATGDPHQAMKGRSLVFKELRVRNPLSVEPQGDMVLLRLEEVPGEQQAWKFSIVSSSNASGVRGGGETAHADGVMSLAADPMLDGLQRLVSGHMRRFTNSSQTEKLKSGRAYGLFSRVVKYDRCFKGMQSVELDQHEALAMVKLPDQQPHRGDSSSWKVCDAVMVDTCVHLVGLLINTSDSMTGGEVAVMVGLDQVVISPAFTMDGAAHWRVYASFADHQQQPIGDVFVCSPDGELVALFTGCRMTKLPITRLERVLDAAFSTSHGAGVDRAPDPSQAATTVTSTPGAGTRSIINTPSTSTQASNGAVRDAAAHTVSALRDLIAECTGMAQSDIPESTALELIGLDSLSSAELSEELSCKFGLGISSNDLAKRTLAELKQLLGIQHPRSDSISNHHHSPPPVGPMPSSHDFGTNGSHGQGAGDQGREKFLHILAEALGARLEDIEPHTTLEELGIDSLSTIDLKQELEENFSVSLDLATDSTVQQIMTHLGIANATPGDARSQDKNNNSGPTEPLALGADFATTPGRVDAAENMIQSNPLDALRALDTQFDSFAKKHGLIDYWSEVAPFQDELTLAYIVEGFSGVGVDLRRFSPGEQVPPIPYLTPKYDKLVRRLWEILEKHGIVSILSRREGDMPQTIVRGSQQIDNRPAPQLLQAFDVRFPAYRNEAKLIGLTGPRLADCLSGKADSVSVMFGSSASRKIMEDYYGSSPVSSTLTDQLAVFLTGLLSSHATRPARILEVGGGTGGTTRWLAKALDEAGIATQYTFTDISPSLVKKAKSQFQPQYQWMAYTTLNLEEDVHPEFRGQFDIVVATNTVHATTDRTASVRRLREMLTPAGGLVVLAELTCHINWCDICFGLLDGWWLADGPIAPLQTAPEWMDTFAEAGFISMGYSTGDTPEAKTAQLLVGCNSRWDMRTPVDERGSGYRLQTMVYKVVDGVQVHADVYYPKRTSPGPMPIALMIHGGGHMMLSRRAVRPAQTRHLLRQGFLPVSIDYRLCPEINLVDGPITDVCDAYRWARTVLPEIVAAEGGLRLDPGRVVVIGWSTGGHLAMSLGWTAEAAGMPPPNAVLSFYAPVDFESGELDSTRFMFLPKPQTSLEHILSSLPVKPITNTSFTSDSSELGLVPGDPHSELLLSLSQQGIALPVLLNGLDSSGGHRRNLDLTPPAPARIASVSPLAQLRAGKYAVPTFIIHGSEDEVAPFAAAERFVDEMRECGVRCGFLPLQGVRHIFDLGLEEGMQKWEDMVAPGYRFLFEQCARI